MTLDDREIREELAAAEAQLKQAETEYERTRVLSERDAATDQALIAAESAFNAARAQVDRVKVMLTYTELRSPIDGSGHRPPHRGRRPGQPGPGAALGLQPGRPAPGGARAGAPGRRGSHSGSR